MFNRCGITPRLYFLFYILVPHLFLSTLPYVAHPLIHTIMCSHFLQCGPSRNNWVYGSIIIFQFPVLQVSLKEYVHSLPDLPFPNVFPVCGQFISCIPVNFADVLNPCDDCLSCLYNVFLLTNISVFAVNSGALYFVDFFMLRGQAGEGCHFLQDCMNVPVPCVHL
ncbi:unnamed protein product [Protopolystoma xenopodis]|uniref:Uncharacterized protein n=1 Tax=Protopolystoma xenopodis TaxID=117903 RepID=A0A448WPP6_9PLAT|nr:unnamed protein product [Protopolystoma xenopodis]